MRKLWIGVLAVILICAGAPSPVRAETLQVRLVSLTSPVSPEDDATLTVQTAPSPRSGPGASSGVQTGPQAACTNPPQPASLLQGSVVRVVDGDTIRVRLANGRTERVRLIGMDTPEVYESEKLERDVRESGRSRAEIQALGRLASDFTRRSLDGRSVGLELDVQIRDRYGRLLAYVWFANGTLFNALILREGYAQILTIPPDVKYVELFVACQREARENNRGLWTR